jgi:hypothetical protein
LWVLTSVADPDPVSGAFLTSGSGINNPDHIAESLETIFLGLKYLNSLMWIRDPGRKKFGSGMEKFGSGIEKIRIQDPD